LAVLLAGAASAPARGAGLDDETGPEISIVPQQGPGASGWYTGRAVLAVTASDARTGNSGMGSVAFVLSGATSGSGRLDKDGGTIVISNDGVTDVAVDATDGLGNVSLKTHLVRIDATKPTITVTFPEDGATYAVGQQVHADHACADALSGLVSCDGTYVPGALIDTTSAGVRAAQVTAEDDAGNERTVEVHYTVVDKTTVLTRPAVQGPARVGDTISATPATFSPRPTTVTCKWFRGDAMLDEKLLTHLVTVDDLGHDLTYRCTAERSPLPAVTSSSDPVAAERGQLPDRDATPITGEGRVGSVLSFEPPVPSAPEGSSTRTQWTRDGATIPGAAGRSYTLTPADLGHTVSAFLHQEASGYEPRDYPATTGVKVDKARGLQVAGQAAVAGTPQVGEQLTATVPTFTPSGAAAATPFSVAVEWLRDGTPVATGTAYRLVAADAGHRMSVRVTASGPGYDTVRVVSADTGAVVAAPGPAVQASTARLVLKALGKGRVRATITVTAGAIRPSGKVTLRRGAGKARSVRLTNGRAVVVLKKQRPGRAVYALTFGGGAGVSAAKATAKVRVR